MNNTELVLTLIDDSSFLRVSTKLINSLNDLSAAILLTKLISLFKYYRETNQLYEGKWFFYTRDNIERDLCLSHFQQRGLFEKLEKNRLIEVLQVGSTNRRNYYTINFDILLELLSQQQIKSKPTQTFI